MLTRIKICRAAISPVVLNGCKTSYVTLRKERRLRVFKNRVFRKIYGPKTGEWESFH
jgi:hypothetical protein